MDLIETSNNSNRHPWELSRTRCLINEIKKSHSNGDILDIGSGDMYFDKELLKNNVNINSLRGIDINLKENIESNKCKWFNDYKKLDIKQFDTIIMMDVIEHIENDDEFLINTIGPLLKNNGKIIMTIPAYQFLYSKHDEVLKHYRRYNIKMIKNLCNKSNFRIKRYHYFYFLLLFPRLLTKKRENKINDWKFNEKSLITRFIKTILNIDYKISSLLGKHSSGLSLFVIMEKCK
jgi:SAM-dependent methyltransferase